MKTKIIQISAGRGPAECTWVVAKVLKVFIEELKQNRFLYKVLQKEDGSENGTIQSVVLKIEGVGLEPFLESWLGTIQWVGTSTFRKKHKRKNWFIGMFEVQQNSNLTIQEKEIKFQAIRSSGPGGQHVNKVSSAVRALHAPTGIQVVAMDSRSQHQNKKLAIQRLHEKVADYNIEQLKNGVKDQWENHLNIERGNPVRVFKGSDFKIKKEEKGYKSKREGLKNDLKKQLWD